MGKSLHDLTKDEWNTLFPIELVDHNPEWKNIYKLEKEKIKANVDKNAILKIEHFGSTSIPSIRAKPYIDIIIATPESFLYDADLISSFTALGYSYFKVPEREGIDAYMSFGKGYVIGGEQEQIFHIHMCAPDNFMMRQLDFRDFLISHTDRAKAYEQLKMEMASKYKNDRGAYVLSKTDFINKTLQIIDESFD